MNIVINVLSPIAEKNKITMKVTVNQMSSYFEVFVLWA